MSLHHFTSRSRLRVDFFLFSFPPLESPVMVCVSDNVSREQWCISSELPGSGYPGGPLLGERFRRGREIVEVK